MMKIKNILLLLVFSGGLLACQNTDKQNIVWKLSWTEDFNKEHLDSNIWTKIPRGPSDWNNFMSSHNSLYALRDGKLILRGVKNTFLPEDTATYLTGGVFTKDKKTFTYGKIVIKAKLQGAKGAWPAFWMLPATRGAWPDGGEIDIMERLNFDSIAYQTVHSDYTVKLGIKDNPISGSTNLIKNDHNFNTFSVEIHPDSLVFAVNDKHTFTYPKINTTKKGQFPFGKPFYLLLDMQLGGNWVGGVTPEDLPVEMEIDWVKFYELTEAH